jgi:LPPG:FO 2-phospho-L-lactate transferase
MSGPVVALSGGVGGAKLAHGLLQALAPGELTIVVNTGDDFQHLGLHVSPDIDSVVYALAGLSDASRGWGRSDESWNFMTALSGLGGADWFQLGDRDLAMHVERTWRLARGDTLGQITAHFCTVLGIAAQVLPMSNDPVRTRLLTAAGWLDFQDYFVRQRCAPGVSRLDFAGASAARAHPAVLATLARSDLRAIVICPSNPFVSIEPILAVPGLRAAIEAAQAPVIAVTPIIGGRAVKGPAAKMMAELGLEVSGAAVARRYAGLIDAFMYDDSEAEPASIPGLALLRAPTLMHGDADRLNLANCVLAAAEQVRSARAPGAVRGLTPSS